MGINKVQFQKGLSMAQFMERYGTEEKCHAAVVALRWPGGFVCPECGETRHCTFERKGLTYWQCSACREQTTVMCGTIFEATKLPLTTWFLAMHLLTQAKNNVLALELKRHLGVRYKTAWLLKHKLMQVMKNTMTDPKDDHENPNLPRSGRHRPDLSGRPAADRQRSATDACSAQAALAQSFASGRGQAQAIAEMCLIAGQSNARRNSSQQASPKRRCAAPCSTPVPTNPKSPRASPPMPDQPAPGKQSGGRCRQETHRQGVSHAHCLSTQESRRPAEVRSAESLLA
jgi:ribosomal protein L37AE/L43A